MTKDDVGNETVDNGMSGKSAVIYCRVASVRQSSPLEELDAQETRCRTYAEQRGLTVVKAYKEHASGITTSRPVLAEMLDFLKACGEQGVIVIVDDISRLARNLRLHFEIREAIGNAGGVIETPTLAVSEDASSMLIETVLVSVAAYRAPNDKAPR
jgi:site-specific DNA recombinase